MLVDALAIRFYVVALLRIRSMRSNIEPHMPGARLQRKYQQRWHLRVAESHLVVQMQCAEQLIADILPVGIVV